MKKCMPVDERNYRYQCTIHLNNWLIKGLTEILEWRGEKNRSSVIQEAIEIYIEELDQLGIYEEESGAKVLTTSLPRKLQDKLTSIAINKYEISRSELVRNAVRKMVIEYYKNNGKQKAIEEFTAYIDGKVIRRLE